MGPRAVREAHAPRGSSKRAKLLKAGQRKVTSTTPPATSAQSRRPSDGSDAQAGAEDGRAEDVGADVGGVEEGAKAATSDEAILAPSTALAVSSDATPKRMALICHVEAALVRGEIRGEVGDAMRSAHLPRGGAAAVGSGEGGAENVERHVEQREGVAEGNGVRRR